MAFRQTRIHSHGKNSFHPIGAFTGQPIACFDRSLRATIEFFADSGAFDGVEISSWDLSLDRAYSDDGARRYAQEIFESCRDLSLQVFSLAAHLQGQCLGDRCTARTIAFQGGEVQKAYQTALNQGFRPPDDDPFKVPPTVADMSREKAAMDLVAVGRLAQYLGDFQDRSVPVSGFVGSAGAWDDIFPFPPIPTKLGSSDDPKNVVIEIGNRADYALNVIFERFRPVWEDYRSRGVRFGLESHPGEIAAGDIVSTKRFLDRAKREGFADTVGLNFDASHLVWQHVDPITFIEMFIDSIWSVHHKGVQVRSNRPANAGVLGGWTDFGDQSRRWDFVYAGSERDATKPEEIIATLNRLGWDGAITIEGEDTNFDLPAAMVQAAKRLAEVDLPPAKGLFDAAFTAK
ncbi:MAG: sugar phosphate isomerase/epimerase [Bdellovibrionales bacterium]|nr:sugar phosphate isomerase/epimerase [Bdellovibrionales bacterium]